MLEPRSLRLPDPATIKDVILGSYLNNLVRAIRSSFNNIEVILFNLGFTRFYETPETELSMEATTEIAHGLNKAPTFIQLLLICQEDDLGYTSGEVIYHWDVDDDTPSNDHGYVISADADNVYIKFSTTLRLVDSSDSFIVTEIDETKWKFKVLIWA